MDQPTDWVSNLVIVERKMGHSGCVWIPTMQEIAAEFVGKTVFSNLDL